MQRQFRRKLFNFRKYVVTAGTLVFIVACGDDGGSPVFKPKDSEKEEISKTEDPSPNKPRDGQEKKKENVADNMDKKSKNPTNKAQDIKKDKLIPDKLPTYNPEYAAEDKNIKQKSENQSNEKDINWEREYGDINFDPSYWDRELDGLLEEPEFLITNTYPIEDYFLIKKEQENNLDENVLNKIMVVKKDYFDLIKRIRADFIANRKQTYREFVDYYNDFNREYEKILNNEESRCKNTGEDDLYCENLKSHKLNVQTGYENTKETLSKMIAKMDKDEIDFYEKYKSDLEEKIEEIKKTSNE